MDGELVAQASGLLLPGIWLQGSRKISKSPQIGAATEGSSPALNKPRQAQAEPASRSFLLREPPGPGARDASLGSQSRGVVSLQRTGRRPSPPRVSFAEAARTCAFNGHLHADGLQPSSSRPNLFSGFQAHVPMCLAANVSLFPTAERIHPGLSPRVSEDALAPKKKKKK